ncbi:MAG: phosphoribosylformylglycinamidine synthase subunit PurL [Spirochaetia bacterium]|nr:phosphoribosylformylglycinamidine synthase subunit PurL [Spirochaetia bacterium]
MSMNLADRSGTAAEALKSGLKEGEFELIVQKIGRNPTFTELAMFSGMWSEHCSYKNSILLLKNLYCESDRLLAQRGEENAGALRISDKHAVVFKIESHNHPSAIEPYQGAATGVGGIMRDVFTMGARPLVSLNSLRFGMPDQPANRHLMREAVRGIGNYGNSLGIPCAGGEIYFHNSYAKNPLVNAMTVGIADMGGLASARASGIGNLVLYVGAKTGRDGIHGASFASKNLSSQSVEERSAVQVGDPFMEKLLMEATLECIKSGLVVAIQDMGAAGLLSSSSEMSASGGVGMDLHLEKVPAREEAMEPFEYLLSESQERMLLIVEPSSLEKITAIFTKWELDCAQIGIITDTKHLRVYHHEKLFADLPSRLLTVNSDGAPRYKRETKKPAVGQMRPELENLETFHNALRNPKNGKLENLISDMVSHPNFASRLPVYEQYDTDIGGMRIIGPGHNGGLYKVPGTKQGIAVTSDGNSFYVAIDPYKGAQHTVAESYRNIIATGADPLGISNCLNFANPYIPENYYFFEQAVTGMSDAAQALKIPVTGGNVSFYNESDDGPVLPTPTIGMVGLIDDVDKSCGINLEPEMEIYLTGFFKPTVGCSQYVFNNTGKFNPVLPELNLQDEMNVGRAVREAIQSAIVSAAIDLSLGGLMMALLRMIFASFRNKYGENKYGKKDSACPGFVFDRDAIETAVKKLNLSVDNFFWGESAHSYLLATKDSRNFETLMSKRQIPFLKTGIVKENNSLLDLCPTTVNLQKLYSDYNNGLAKFF